MKKNLAILVSILFIVPLSSCCMQNSWCLINPFHSGAVVYASKPINAGELIKASALEEAEMLCSLIPNDALTSGTIATGRFARTKIAKGEIICQHHLAPQSINLTSGEMENPECEAALLKFAKESDD